MFYEEQKIQESLVLYMFYQYPKVIFTCAPANAKSPRQGAINKRMGYRKNWPDLFFAEPRKGFHGLFLEFKTKTGTYTAGQKEMNEELNSRGYKSIVAYSFDEAVAAIDAYLK